MINNVISSISYLEFVNEINSLVNELLYSPQNGYTNLKSKDAILNFQKVIENFKIEANKISKNTDFSNAQDLIEAKRKNLILAIQKHYDSQVPIWAQEVFDVLIDNLLFELSLNKDNAQMIWNKIIEAISWISDIQKLNENAKQTLSKEIEKEFIQTINSNDSDFMPLENAIESDKNEFMKIWNLVLENEKEFLALDFSKKIQKLNNHDIKYFENIKNTFSTYRKTAQIDELNLIQSAIKHLKLKENELIYDFIKQINNDFILKSQSEKTLLEEEKVKLIKRRMALFKDKSTTSKDYFDKLITSSLNE